jgi:hypothetical protein
VKFLREQQLSGAGSELVQFDADSIKQIARPDEPDLWVADPHRYERNGRILRDSERPRMLAYSSARQTLYATDGCNSCARHLPAKLKEFAPEELRTFADENELPIELLQYLISLL